jgi:hypothetical protein
MPRATTNSRGGIGTTTTTKSAATDGR